MVDASDPDRGRKFPHTLHHLPCLCLPLLQTKQEEGKRYVSSELYSETLFLYSDLEQMRTSIRCD